MNLFHIFTPNSGILPLNSIIIIVEGDYSLIGFCFKKLNRPYRFLLFYNNMILQT